MQTKRTQLLILGVLVSLVGGGALADETSMPDEVGDQLGPMSFDIQAAERGHARLTEAHPRFLAHTVVSAQPVSDETLEEERVQLRFNFDTRGDRSFERSIVVSYAPGETRSDMWRGGYPFHPEGLYEPADWLGFVEASRPDDRSIRVWFPRALLGRAVDRAGSYRWMVEVYRLPGWNSFCEEGDVSPCYDKTSADVHEIRSRR